MAKRANWSSSSGADSDGIDTPVTVLGAFDTAFNGAGLPPGNQLPETGTQPNQIVFIEGSVADVRILANGVRPGVKVVILNPDANGVQQIADYLRQHDIQNLNAISIVADGTDGELQLGNTLLSAGDIAASQEQLAAIGAALKPGGDLLVYGCDVARNGAGDAFLRQLSQATGVANIAASSHLVGAAADGGDWDLNVNVGTIDAASPFTAEAISAYPDELSLSNDQIIFATYNEGNASTDNGDRVEQFGASGASEISGSTIDLGDGSQSSYSGLNYLISGIAVDTAKHEYFAAVDDNATGGPYALTIQEGSLSGTGGVTKVFTDPLQDAADPNIGNAINFAILGGLAIDAQTNELYYAQAAENTDTGDTVAVDTGIYQASISGSGNLSPTLLTSPNAGLVNPDYMALDASANLLFFDDSIEAGGVFPATDNLDEVNLATGSVTVMESFFSSTDSVDLLQGLAVNGNTIYLTTVDYGSNTSANNQILSIPFTVSGSGSTAKATVGASTTLYSGTGAHQPTDIVIDAAQGIFYTTGEQFVQTGTYYGAVYEGSLSGGTSLTEVLSMSTIITNGDAAQNTDPTELVVLTQPTITASGTVTATAGGSAVTVDPGVTASDPDGQNLASATITGALTGDTLSYNGGVAKVFTDSFTITSTFSSGTLTLGGNASPADYQAALDAVAFATTSTNATARTIDWTVSDGVASSATEISTVDVRDAPTVTAGASVTFDGGGSPVALDSGLAVTDPSSSTLIGASVTIVGDTSTDRLNFGTQSGISGSYNTSNGVLTLTGTASVANYQTALRSITYDVSPSNSDPTDGGGDTSRTIDWTVNDGVLSASVVTSTLDTVHEPPTVAAGGTPTFDGGGSPVPLDASATAADGDSGGDLTKATVIIGGYLNGDTLTVGTPGDLGVTFNNGTLTLSGSVSIATYNSALDSVEYGFTAGADPTGGGSHTSRTISWSVNDGVASSITASSALNVVHVAPTIAAGGTATFTGGGPAVALDIGLTVSDGDSGNVLSSATVAVVDAITGDTLNFSSDPSTDGNIAVASDGDGVLVLTSSGSTATMEQWQTALESVTYNFSPSNGDPTVGGTDKSRTIDWTVNDGSSSNGGSGLVTSTLDLTLCYCRGSRILTDHGEVAVEDLRIGDRVVTFSGAARPIRWIGHRDIDLTRHPAPEQAQPIRIRANAVADGVPRRDLLLSPDHAVLFDGLLVIARLLVNGASIEREVQCNNVTYYHIELETHDILMAEGLPAESYLDTGNRGAFENAGVPMILHPDFADGQRQRIARSCRRFASDAASVEPIWRHLATSAARLGFTVPAVCETTCDPGLRVVADGRAFSPVSADAGRYTFALPRFKGPARLVSRAARPCDALPWVEDRRRLGVRIRRLTMRHGHDVQTVAMDDPKLDQGWWAVEWDDFGPCRWTRGDAVLPFPDTGVLVVELSGTMRYPVAKSLGSSPPFLARSASDRRHAAR